MKKNILEFCLSPDLGGLELFVVNSYNYFKTQTSSYIMVAPNKKLDNYLEDNNKCYLKRNKFFPIIPALELAKFIDEKEIDIIHFHWTKDIATVVLAKTLSKRNPKIIQTRNMTMTRFKSDFYHKWLYKNVHTMHAVTHQVKEQIQKFVPQEICPNVEVVYMGTDKKNINISRVDALKSEYNLDDAFIVGIVGRIEEGKGQYLVIDAINQLKDLHVKALIVGHTMNEEYLNGLKNTIKNKGIEDKVVFTGFTKEVNEHMSLCDITVLATKKETFGLVVIESMVNKVPVVATNTGGPMEIINDHKDGLLFNRSVEDLVEKIKLVYNDTNLKDTLSKNAYNKAIEKFDNSLQINKLYDVIKRM